MVANAGIVEFVSFLDSEQALFYFIVGRFLIMLYPSTCRIIRQTL